MPLSPRTLRPQASASAGVSFVDPTSLSGLVLWLDADDPTTMYDATTGGSQVALEGTIARWQDKSGQNNHATQFILNNRPIKKTAFINGKPAVHHYGVDDCMELTANIDSVLFTALGVIRRTSALSTDTVLCLVENTLGLGNVQTYLWYNGFDADTLTVSATRRASTPGKIDHYASGFGYAAMSTNPTLMTMRMNPSRFRANKTSYTVSEFQTGLFIASSFGNLCGEPGVILSYTAIGELVIYNRSLTDAEFTACENYLSAKWGL